MADKIYSIDELKRLISPVAQSYGVERVTLFGSYARGQAKHESDIDLRIDKGAIADYFELAGFHRELSEKLMVSVDVLTTGMLENDFLTRISKEEVVLYEVLEQNTLCPSQVMQ